VGEKMKKSFLSLLLIFIIYSLNTAAQEKDLSVLVKFGQSDYHNSGLSRDNTSNIWENGLQFSVGIEKRLSSSFSVQGLFSYSIEGIAQNYWLYQVNDAKNRVYDLMGNMKLNIGIFYFIGGVGLSYQKSDAVDYILRAYPIVPFSTALIAAKEKLMFAGLLGLGLDIYVYRQINLITEADMNMREYTGTSLLVGIKYSL
jgi:hypothetical protein